MATETKKELKKDVNMWKIFSLGLIVILCVTVFIILSGVGATATSVSPEAASDKAVTFINDNLVQPGTTATLVSNEEVGGLYNVTVSYQGNDIPVFVTKDGKYMFLASPLDITENLPQPEDTTTQPTQAPQTDTPDVELYVMAFCPYGTQAEDAMKPVVDLLGNDANIQVHYIATVQGDTLDSISSLHGATEAVEDVRQLCIMENYDQTTFWNYVMDLNSNCVSKYNDATAYNACWKDTASQNGIDASQIETCINSEGVDLISVDSQYASLNQVSGSPTLIINGVRYSGARTPDAYKQAICDAFTTAPADCSQELSGSTTSTTGSC
jgi:protein-disulfide isomerase